MKVTKCNHLVTIQLMLINSPVNVKILFKIRRHSFNLCTDVFKTQFKVLFDLEWHKQIINTPGDTWWKNKTVEH
jgi:hypothetical protein